MNIENILKASLGVEEDLRDIIEDGFIVLELQKERELALIFDNEREWALFFRLGFMELSVENITRCLEANFMGEHTGGFTLSIDPETRGLVLHRRFSVVKDGAAFSEGIKTLIEELYSVVDHLEEHLGL